MSARRTAIDLAQRFRHALGADSATAVFAAGSWYVAVCAADDAPGAPDGLHGTAKAYTVRQVACYLAALEAADPEAPAEMPTPWGPGVIGHFLTAYLRDENGWRVDLAGGVADSDVWRTCRVCGARYSRQTFAARPHVGDYEGCGTSATVELRNCACRSTMSVEVKS